MIIGISSNYSSNHSSIGEEYVQAVWKAGGTPLILPLAESDALAEAILTEVDGLLLIGGEDVDPARYGEDVLNETVHVNAERDASDFRLAEEAVRRGIPILGICRGEQLINVCCGGTLWQDLPSQVGTEVIHARQGSIRNPSQMVYIEKGSRLHELLGVDSIGVNSSHHQAVKQPGKGLVVIASAADGVTEGIQSANNDAVLAVQFHPEQLVAGGDNRFLVIFENLVERAKHYARRH